MEYVGALFTDVDGTLFRGSLEIALAKNLISKGLVKHERIADILRLEREHRHRQVPFEVVVRAWVDALDSDVFEGVSSENILDAARELVEQDGQMVYVFTRELIASCKEHGYLVVAISGSSEDIVVPFCKQFGFDIVVGSIYPQRYGTHAADKPLRQGSRNKDATMERVLVEYGLHYPCAIAIGDTAADYPMLRAALWPIAFNPNGDLLDLLCGRSTEEYLKPIPVVRESKDAVTAERLRIYYQISDSQLLVSCDLCAFLPQDISADMRLRLGRMFKNPAEPH